MPRPDRILTSLAALFALLFTFGILGLFHLRFERGDLYPAYSSLRTDPLGTKALYESFSNLSAVNAERNYNVPATKAVSPDSTLFSLGVELHQLESVSPEEARALDRYMSAGGRFVIAMYPEFAKDMPDNECKDESGNAARTTDTNSAGPVNPEAEEEKRQSLVEDTSDQEQKNDSEREEQPTALERVNLPARFGFSYSHDRAFAGESAYAAVVQADPVLPASIAWHNQLYFTNLAQDWRIIYQRDSHPVIIEKNIGRGTLVLVADSYLFSNEALSKTRYPGLLAYLAADAAKIVFDEAHLGLSRTQSTAGLLRKYRLHWFIGGLFALTGLFIWKNSLSFMPPAPSGFQDADQAVQQKKDYTEGLINLLRRYIPPGDVLAVGLSEWNKQHSAGLPITDAIRKKMEELISRKGHEDPVTVYRSVAKILADSNTCNTSQSITTIEESRQ